MADLPEYILGVLPLLALELGKAAVVVGDLTCLIQTWLEMVGKEDGLAVVEEAEHRRIGQVGMAAPADLATRSSRCISNRFSCASSNLFY